MNKKVILVILVILAAVVFGWLVYRQIASHKQTTVAKSEEIILFYSNTCPHCQEVEKFIETNNVRAKINLQEKEIHQSQKITQELQNTALKCNLPIDNLTVPFLSAEGKCFSGAPDIISYFSQKAGITEAKQ